MRIQNLALAVGLAGILAACTPETPAAVPSSPLSSAAAPTSALAPAASSAVVAPAASTVAAAPPEVPGVAAEESSPPGVVPLTEAEAKEVEDKCSRLGPAIKKQVNALRKAGKSATDAMLEALQTPPKVAGTDVPRCVELMRRYLIEDRAQTIESEAKNNLKAMSVALAGAMERTPPELCPSAPAVPASLDALKSGPWSSAADAWDAPGWKCARFTLTGSPQYFQYELRTNAANKTWEIVARGFPVPGQPSTELFLRGNVQDGKITPSSNVMRRR